MFKFLNFFKRKQQNTGANASSTEATDSEAVAPGTQLRYDEQLVHKLQADHKQLLKLFGDISTAYEQNDFKALPNKLTIFSDKLREHLLLENLKLYIYLKHVLKSDQHSTAVMNNFYQEMKEIGKVVNGFVNKYSQSNWSETMKASFYTDITKIETVFVKRIETEEEKLYPLYKHPDSYN